MQKKGFTEDAYNNTKRSSAKYGQKHKKITKSDKKIGSKTFDTSTDEKRLARAEKYAKKHRAELKKDTPEYKLRKAIGMATLAVTYDQLVFQGEGRKFVHKALKKAGQMTVTAFLAANGHTNIRWHD